MTSCKPRLFKDSISWLKSQHCAERSLRYFPGSKHQFINISTQVYVPHSATTGKIQPSFIYSSTETAPWGPGSGRARAPPSSEDAPRLMSILQGKQCGEVALRSLRVALHT